MAQPARPSIFFLPRWVAVEPIEEFTAAITIKLIRAWRRLSRKQPNFFNAQLGVIREHSKKTPPVTGVDAATGTSIELTNDMVSFKKPHVLSATTTEGGAVVELAAANQK